MLKAQQQVYSRFNKLTNSAGFFHCFCHRIYTSTHRSYTNCLPLKQEVNEYSASVDYAEMVQCINWINNTCLSSHISYKKCLQVHHSQRYQGLFKAGDRWVHYTQPESLPMKSCYFVYQSKGSDSSAHIEQRLYCEIY